MSDKPVVAVLGIGPGLGSSVARRFAAEGCAVAAMARDEQHLQPVVKDIRDAGGTAEAVTVDAGDAASVHAAFERCRQTLGDPQVLVYNAAGPFVISEVLELDPDVFERAWRVNCFGAFLAVREVLPAMQRAGTGTLLLTGATAALRGSAGFSALAVGKFGLRALAQSLAREYGAQGIHVAHVIVDGQIDSPRIRRMFPNREAHTFLDPDRIADEYWHLYRQDPTTWSLEADLRPAVEKF